jgi:hypothetical protein
MNHDGLLAPARLAAYAAGVAVALEYLFAQPTIILGVLPFHRVATAA